MGAVRRLGRSSPSVPSWSTCWSRSPWGRLLRGIREDEDAIRSLGKNVFAIKMQALVIGGMLGALGGMVYVLPGSVQADALGRSMTFFCYTALLIGGAATVFGPILGSIIFYTARIFVKSVANAYVPDSIMSSSETESFSYIVVGVDPDAGRDLQTTRHPRQQEGAAVQCLSRPPARRWPIRRPVAG